MNQVASLPAQGDLAQFPLRDLLQGHAALRSCGRLVVRTSAGEAWVKLWDGAVSEAHFGPATGEAAVLRLMTFQEGGFQFEPHPDSVAGATASAMKDLLDRGEAHHQEVLHHAGKLGGLSAVFTLELGQISRLDADIRQEIAPILGLVDGRRTVQEVVAATEMPDVTVLRVMRKLRSQGLLRSAEELEAERLAREEAQRAAEAAAAAAAEAAAEAARRPPTVEEMMMQQAVRQEDERALLASLAAGVAPPSTEEERKERAARAERFAAAEPTPLTAPPARRNTPPAGMPVAQQGMSPPPAAAAPATAPAAAAPAPRARDEVRLARGAGAPEPAITRWTERPERSPEDRPEDELTPVSPVPLPPEGRAPLNDEGGSRMAGPDAVTDPPAAAPPAPAAAPAPAETPTPPPRTGPPEESALNPAPAPPRRMSVTSDEHDTFFTRGSDVKEIEALLDKNAAADAEESNKRLFLYVSAGVGTVALLLVLLFLSSAPPAAPTAEAPPVAEPAPAAPTPNVVIPDMGAQVKSQQEAAAELVRHDTTEPAASAAPPKSAAELAGELAAEKPAVAAVQPAPVPAKPVEQPVVAPVAAKPVEKPAEKPADDPKRLFADRFEKGKKLLDQEKYEDAKKAFESALKFDPGSARAYAQLGRVQYELGNQDEALRQLRKAEALDASHSYTHLVMGMLLQERGDLPGAEKAYEKYLALDSTSGNARAVQGFLKALRAQRAAKK